MEPQTLELLARDFSADGARWERGPGDLSFLVVETPLCRARLTPYGGQLCEWTLAGATAPVLFLSPRSAFAPGKAIRGGVPVCFPWFGNHPHDATKPAHGFARTRTWQVGRVEGRADGSVVVDLRLSSDDETRRLWDADFAATLSLELGEALEMRFEVENRGAKPLEYEIALHSYLTVGDAETVRVRGLEGASFIDKVDGMKRKTQPGEPLVFRGETDRVFVDTTATCLVEDPVLRRTIRIDKTGSLATVAWNPGADKAGKMADVGDAWRSFVCVETASCGPHTVRLAPGERRAIVAGVRLA